MLSQKDDLSAHKKQLLATRKELSELKTALNAHAIVVTTDSQGVITECNDRFCEISQYARDELIGQTHRLIGSGKHSKEFFQQLWRTISSGQIWNGEICNRAKDGSFYWVHTTIVPFMGSDAKPIKYIAIRADITLRKKAEQHIYHLAMHDGLTELPNRVHFNCNLQKAIDDIANTHQHAALVFLDLDNFKDINDRLGHDIGDELLKKVAHQLSCCIRPEDTVARLGGDEFVLLFTHLDENFSVAMEQAKGLAQRVRKAIDTTFTLGNLLAHCSCSIGLVVFNQSESSKIELMKQADMALYKAKEQGRNALCVFDSQLQAEVLNRSTLLHDLQLALSRKEFFLHYQCLVGQERKPRAFEALVRWQHPTKGILPPGAFIELAEQSGLIIELGQWVLETACMQLVEWSNNKDTAHLTISVNVSAHQFQDARFVSSVRNTLRRTGANPSLLCLELTESVFLSDIEKNILKMQELRAIDVRFALDDFGTGYSSLQHIKRLPLDILKIDRSFVKGLPEDTDDAAIIAAILALASTLNLLVVAEGVETEAQFEYLLKQGVKSFQGYYFAKPVPIEEISLYL